MIFYYLIASKLGFKKDDGNFSLTYQLFLLQWTPAVTALYCPAATPTLCLLSIIKK
jgi:hypothetical protein